MKKQGVPVLIVLVLIFVIGVAGLSVHMIQKYTPSKEKMDAEEYFGTDENGGLPLVFGDEILEDRGLLQEKSVYLPLSLVTARLDSHFYWDEQEQLLLYTTATKKYVAKPDQAEYTVNDENEKAQDKICLLREDEPYINLDFICRFQDVEYQLYEAPTRLVLQYQWEDASFVTVKEDSAAVRYQGGIKSLVLTEVSKGTQLRLLEKLEDWDKVMTEDGFLGYIRKKDLEKKAQEKTYDRDFQKEEYTSLVRDHKINLAWHQVTSKEANQTLQEVMNNTQAVNVISPTWFTIKNNKGDVASIAQKSYVAKAHKMGLEVWGLVDNFGENVDTYTILSKTGTRTKFEKNLIRLATYFQLDGINIDLETLSEETTPHFIQFLRELSILCRANNLVLSVDNPVPESYNLHYDMAAQAEVVDYIIIMGYDEHYYGSEEAGSVASLSWVEAGIQKTLEGVPSSKTILAVPFYTRIWKTSAGIVTSEAVGMEAAAEFIAKNKVETYWNEDVSQVYGQYEDGNDLYQVWLEDKDSIGKKAELVPKYDLAGIAEWKLGFETPDVWQTIAEALQ